MAREGLENDWQCIWANDFDTKKAETYTRNYGGDELIVEDISRIEIENHSYTTADQQLGRPGDFLINDTVFHVTVAPMPAVIGKCENNIRQGYRAILLVPESKTMAAKQMAETLNVNQIGIFSIETFVGQNIEEISQYQKNELTQGFLNFLRKYNERVAAVETDLSMQIEIPENL